MLLTLILALTLVPLVQLYLLIRLAGVTGPGFTIALVIGTGIAGGAIARWQGLTVVQRIRRELAEGQMPTASILDGVMILVAGALLLTPGLLTDALGFFLLAPPGRALIRGSVRKWLQRQVKQGRWQVHTGGPTREPRDVPFEYKDTQDSDHETDTD